jgi:glycosyltransferase involved in cell wall biosynthesis/SAM-dependent methyltransferase
MVPKQLFSELGGFDEHYLPAYCEDSDLALKIRDKGYRVIYQPLSTLIHYEGITSGTDTTQGTKAYQIENSKKLFQRWQHRLKAHQAPGVDADNAKDRMAKRRVLVLEHCTPTPNQDAGSVTVFNLLLLLREMDFQVTFIPEDNFLYMPEYTTALQRVGIEVLYAPYVSSVETHLKECGSRYDFTLLFRGGVVERNIEVLRQYCPKAKVLFHTVDLHFLRMQREAELFNDKTKMKQAAEMRQREFAAIRAADATIVHSTAELELLRPEFPNEKISVFPLIMDVPGTNRGFLDRRDIVFVGGYQHTPNIDAVQFFASEIMPLLRKQLPGVRFYAAGRKPPAEIEKLACEDVIITGFVEDLIPLLDKMRVSVAPLRYGAGIKGKIGSAMAVGLPVVATSLAAEGMSLTEGENIVVADGAEAFATTVVRLYEDEALWNKLSTAGLEFADQAWGAEAAWGILANILTGIGILSERGANQLSLYMGRTIASETNNKPPKITHEETKQKPSQEYLKKIQQELSIYEKQVKVHDLPEIYHYWSNKFMAPIFQEAGVQSIEGFFADNLLEAKKRTENSPAYFVSIGSGNCDLEIDIAKLLVKAGCQDFIFECVEINPVMLDRGKTLARENGLLANMKFIEADFNSWRASKKYDGVMANQSLHHVTDLEHLYDQIKIGLQDRGSLVISDMIGRNGHQRWPESLGIVNMFWKELPESYKFNVLLNRLENEYDNWDCSKEGFEGIRAQDVLPLLVQRFECEKFIGFGSAIDIFVDRCFGHNFDATAQWDREFIDRVHGEDEAGLIQGKLTPTHMIAVFVKNLYAPQFFSRGLDPLSSIRNP